VNAQGVVQKDVGYTPIWVLPGVSVPLRGQGPDPTVTKTFNADRTQVTVTALAKFRVNLLENILSIPINHLHRLAWAWARISYTINIDGSASAIFTGSLVPSQTDYWNYISIGGYQMSSNVDPFLNAPYGSLGPSNGSPTTGGN